jgi:hypothetical protein
VALLEEVDTIREEQGVVSADVPHPFLGRAARGGEPGRPLLSVERVVD